MMSNPIHGQTKKTNVCPVVRIVVEEYATQRMLLEPIGTKSTSGTIRLNSYCGVMTNHGISLAVFENEGEFVLIGGTHDIPWMSVTLR